jgi:hypothetical protein
MGGKQHPSPDTDEMQVVEQKQLSKNMHFKNKFSVINYTSLAIHKCTWLKK